MKTLILSTVVVSTILANNINIEVTNILNKNGSVFIGLYDKADSFSIISENYKGVIVDIKSDVINYTFENVPNGTYAISLFHDENDNKIHDKNFFGIPSEGYGFSNNIRPIFRGANFEESKIELKGDKNLTINMGY